MLTSTQNDLATRLHKELRGQGYDVEIRPQIETETGVLTPDLLGRKDDQTLLVGIKSLGTGEAEAERMRGLAAFAQSRDGHHFRLVLAEPVRADAQDLPSLSDIKERLPEARRLFRGKDAVPGWLFAWALLTAAAARRLQSLGISAAEGETARSLAKTLVAHGLAAQNDLTWLDAAAIYQERLAAGHVVEKADKKLFDRLCSLVHELSSVMKGENLPDTMLRR
jgi:hypothetical protein